MAHVQLEEALVIDVSLVDWGLLSKQKTTLIKVLAKLETANPEWMEGSVKQDVEDLTGILHFLDFIQDSAVDSGLPEDMVFPNLGKGY